MTHERQALDSGHRDGALLQPHPPTLRASIGDVTKENERLRIENGRLLEAVALEREHVLALQATLHTKNVALDALHYVFCAGACDDGSKRYRSLALEVAAAENPPDVACFLCDKAATDGEAALYAPAQTLFLPIHLACVDVVADIDENLVTEAERQVVRMRARLEKRATP